MQEQPTIQAQACFGGCLLHEGAGGANWSRCKSLGEGGISAHAREAGGGGGQAGLKALHTCTSWYVYAAMPGSSNEAAMIHSCVRGGGGDGGGTRVQ